MKLVYRPEIDGLRAVAVSVVILYHAQITAFGINFFEGGFVGVDIFFVISGYLITSIILKELIKTGRFSFKYFYERRIRRILPVLLAVMLFSFPFAWMYLLPSDFIDFSKSILYALGFNSNFYFYYSGQEYDAASGLLKPFLHTWSLSVEEQFYILFPLILIITFKYFKNYLLHILIFGFVVSLFLASWGSKNHPEFNFYMLPTRVWELLAGSILAYFEITKSYRCENKNINIIFPVLGFILISYSVLFFNYETFHPSFWTLIPVVGVCLIIYFSNKNGPLNKILSTKLLVRTGLISYSLYIWHYPIIAFARITENYQNNANKLLTIIIIIIFSIISYYFIEQPFRNKRKRFNEIIKLLIISISILIIFNFSVLQKDGFKIRGQEMLQKNFTISGNLLKNLEGERCANSINGCKFNTSSDSKVYIIGDSHMGSLIYDLKNKLVEKQYQLITRIVGGCIYFPGFTRVKLKNKKIDMHCNDKYFENLRKTLAKEKNSILIFGGRLPLYISNSFFNNKEGGIELDDLYKYISVGDYASIQDSFKNEIFKLSKNNKIILVYPIPEVGWNPNQKIFLNKYNKEFKNITTSYEVYKKRTEQAFNLLDSIQNNNVSRVYPHTLFCDTLIKGRCLTHDDKNIFYSDDDHVSTKGAAMINDLIIEQIEKIRSKH